VDLSWGVIVRAINVSPPPMSTSTHRFGPAGESKSVFRSVDMDPRSAAFSVPT